MKPASLTSLELAPIDFDFHGLARVRLTQASSSDARAVARQLGFPGVVAAGPADVVVRYVDHFPGAGSARPVGLEDAAVANDAFLLVLRRRGRLFHVQVPFEKIGQGCEIVCERGLGKLPMLIPILNLTLLAKGVVPVHASAFTYEGVGVLVTGWSKGGKTETLLAFMEEGARYVGDEWVYISADGARLSGIPIPIRVWGWHLEHAPVVRARIALRHRIRLGALRAATALASAFPGQGSLARACAGASFVDLRPGRLFGADRRESSARFDQLVFAHSDGSPEVRVEPMDPREVARRMSFSFLYESLHFMGNYLKFRFAFPGTSSSIVDRVLDVYGERLEAVLVGKPTHALYHPYPAPIPELFRALASRLH